MVDHDRDLSAGLHIYGRRHVDGLLQDLAGLLLSHTRASADVDVALTGLG